MVPEFSDICVPDCIPTHTEIPVHEVEKYRYRYTGFEFGPVPITRGNTPKQRVDKENVTEKWFRFLVLLKNARVVRKFLNCFSLLFLMHISIKFPGTILINVTLLSNSKCTRKLNILFMQKTGTSTLCFVASCGPSATAVALPHSMIGNKEK